MSIVISNATILTMDRRSPYARSMLIENGKVAALDIDAVPESVPVVDFGGRTIVPAFGDCHTHFTFTGCQVIDGSLAGCQSIAELQDELREAVRSGAHNGIIRRWNLDDHALRDRRPSIVDLDAVTSEIPVILSRVGNGASLLNSAALHAASLDADDESVESVNGAPTGWVWGEANHRALDLAITSLTDQEVAHSAQAASTLALSQGVTLVHAIEGSFAGQAQGDRGRQNVWLRRLRPLLDELPIECCPLDCQLDSPADLDRIARDGHHLAGGDLFLDGVLGAAYIPGMARAALDAPYSDGAGGAGHLLLTDSHLLAFARAAAVNEISLGVHAVGERAIAQFLDAWEIVLAERPDARKLRPRIDHGILPRPDDIARAAELGVAFSMQPVFERRSGGPNGQYAQRIGWERARRTHRFRSLRHAGVMLAGGSDSPVNPIAPLDGIRAAVTHSVISERLTPIEAIELFTTGSAFLSFQETSRGSLAPGKIADFAVLSADPLDEVALPHVTVEATWHAGTLTWSAPEVS